VSATYSIFFSPASSSRMKASERSGRLAMVSNHGADVADARDPKNDCPERQGAEQVGVGARSASEPVSR